VSSADDYSRFFGLSHFNALLPCSITLPIFVACYLGWKFAKRTKWVTLDDMDFVTGSRELDEMDQLEREKDVSNNTWWGKVW
jgi:amino acid transporter